jgi:XRE family transcriptional regulator, regulator of sulfur utilization
MREVPRLLCSVVRCGLTGNRNPQPFSLRDANNLLVEKELSMITCRDIAVAAAAVLLILSLIGRAEQKEAVQGSTVFDWNSIPAKPTESGSVRLFFKGPTATLDNLDIHVTTLDPGKAPHPPHKHLNEELVIIKEGTLEFLENGEWR